MLLHCSKDWNTKDHTTRCLNYEKTMEKILQEYSDDKETAIFYALALDGTSGPADKSYSDQKKSLRSCTNIRYLQSRRQTLSVFALTKKREGLSDFY